MLAPLKPGERKILQALTTGNKLFKDLREQCVKNPNILSSYLKNLQKTGLILRDIDTRKFKLTGNGWETLYIANICDLITEYGFRKTNIKLLGLDIIVSEKPILLESMSNVLAEEDARNVFAAFSKINQFLLQVWRKQVLSFFSKAERQIIEEYEQAFHDAILVAVKPAANISKESSKPLAEKRLKLRYPNIEIPATILEIEAETVFKEMMENETRAIMLEIGNPKTFLERLKDFSSTDENQARLKPLIDCLADARKVKIHNRYMKSLRACPKTIIIFSSLAFGDYLKKRWQLFPDEEQKFRKRHLWLYSQIQELDAV
jgi:predicted transcriptional regulator